MRENSRVESRIEQELRDLRFREQELRFDRDDHHHHHHHRRHHSRSDRQQPSAPSTQHTTTTESEVSEDAGQMHYAQVCLPFGVTDVTHMRQ